MLKIYRFLLVFNLLVSTLFTFGWNEEKKPPFSSWGYYLQIGIVAIFLLLLTITLVIRRKVTSRGVYLFAYGITCIVSTEILRHPEGYPLMIGNVGFQIYWYIAEVILCAILLKNDFHKEYLPTAEIKTGKDQEKEVLSLKRKNKKFT